MADGGRKQCLICGERLLKNNRTYCYGCVKKIRQRYAVLLSLRKSDLWNKAVQEVMAENKPIT